MGAPGNGIVLGPFKFPVIPGPIGVANVGGIAGVAGNAADLGWWMCPTVAGEFGCAIAGPNKDWLVANAGKGGDCRPGIAPMFSYLLKVLSLQLPLAAVAFE